MKAAAHVVAAQRPPVFESLAVWQESLTAERIWLAEGAIEGQGVTVWTGPEKSHKSWIMADLAVATAIGGMWLHTFQIRQPGRVLIFDGEYGGYETTRRVHRIARAHGADPKEVAAQIDYAGVNPYLDHLANAASEEDDLNEDKEDLLVRLRSAFKSGESPSLVIVDPLRSHIGGNEDSTADVKLAMAGLKRLQAICNAPIIVCHHLNKSGGASGNRAIQTAADLLITGTDDDVPTYTARGRILRTSDRIGPGKKFTVEVEHTVDEDDLQAKTFLRARFEEGSTRTKSKSANQSKPAQRVMAALKASPKGMTSTQLAEVESNGKRRKKILEQLIAEGSIQRKGTRYALSTANFLEELAK